MASAYFVPYETFGNIARSENLVKHSGEEQLRLLASDGMLVKRPIIVDEDKVLIGFKPDEWEKLK